MVALRLATFFSPWPPHQLFLPAFVTASIFPSFPFQLYPVLGSWSHPPQDLAPFLEISFSSYWIKNPGIEGLLRSVKEP